MTEQKSGGVMRREPRVRFLLFFVCLVAAMPFAWGADIVEDLNVEGSNSLNGEVSWDVLKIMVTLCHTPPGDPANAQTIVVGQAAVAAHLAHGDSLGACPQVCAGVPSAVPKTGQTACWDGSGTLISCAGTGQDGQFQLGASASPRFTDNGNGTVRDNLTGLIWLKDANCFSIHSFHDWTTALSLSNALAAEACGLTDGSAPGAWRLPNIRELQSLIDYGQFFPALPTGHPFSGVQPHDYWSSTSVSMPDPSDPSFPNAAWAVHFELGHVDYFDKGNTHGVWPVRGGQ